MVSVDKAFEMRYRKAGKEVQILVDFDELQSFRKNPQEKEIEDVVADDKIYSDQKKGELAPDSVLKEMFSTQNHQEILKEILLEGECQIPTAYLNKLREEKKTQIINYIAENAINPQTKTKYTYSMIENALSDIKTTIDPLKDHIYQAEQILKDLRKKLPISMDRVLMIIKIPGEHCGKFYGNFRKLGTIQKEYFDDHGRLHLHFEISQGNIDTVADYIKSNTQGTGEYHIQQE